MSFDLSVIAPQFGGGAAIGAFIGYAAKKIVKIIVALIGVQMAFLAYLEQQGIISVNWSQLQASMGFVDPSGAIPPFVMSLFSIAPVGGGFTIGAIAGFKKG
jgi:uncharacterized membrane protein (Fun14 family)